MRLRDAYPLVQEPGEGGTFPPWGTEVCVESTPSFHQLYIGPFSAQGSNFFHIIRLAKNKKCQNNKYKFSNLGLKTNQCIAGGN